MEQETSWTAVIALVLSIIAIIFIIIIHLSNSNITGIGTISSGIDGWTVIEGGTSGIEVFVAAPNTMLNVARNAGPSYNIAIAPYPNIDSIIAGQKKTVYKIANTRSASGVAANPPAGTKYEINDNNTPSPVFIARNTTATYVWLSPTLIQRIK